MTDAMTAAWVLLSAAACCVALGAAAPPGDGGAALPPTCDSKIYCQGDLLKVVQTASLYVDSKTFVDHRLLNSPEETLAAFEAFLAQTGGDPTKDQVQSFVDQYFAEGNELTEVDLEDWVENPPLLDRIVDSSLQKWASDLNGIWKELSRKVNDTVKDNSDRYSIIYLPNHFVVPGGRFRELYYWDTYWVVKGLLLSEMRDTVKGILENFLYLIRNYDIIPNGARIYYLERTQPPLLTHMVWDYFQETNDVDFLRENIGLLDKEADFWLTKRTVQVEKDGKTYKLLHYYSPSSGPRPESYREDYANAQIFSTDERKEEFYIDLKSAAESGWDFSSRWFIVNGTSEGNLTDIHIKYIVPVDINAFVYGQWNFLSKLHSVVGNTVKSNYYAQIASQLQEAVTAVLWNEELGAWFDYDILNNKQRIYFYPSNVAPLWTQCYDQVKTTHIAQKVVQYLKDLKIPDFLGGTPTSLQNSGEQWDLPNAWPPLQHIIITGLESTEVPVAQDLAFSLARQWIRSNYKAYQDSEEMFEKYDAELFGKYGGGGEYTVQSGFGWTNGVALDFLHVYGDRLTVE